MDDLVAKFDLLGFDLLGLENVVYFSADGIPPDTKKCTEGKCTYGCHPGCALCSPGCIIGGV